MKFLIDAQLPARPAEFLKRAGHDAIHTIELPDGNRSTDDQLSQCADIDGRVVVTKDQDFRDGHRLAQSPRQLLVVTTGNIANDALLSVSNYTSTPSSLRSRRSTSSNSPRMPWR